MDKAPIVQSEEDLIKIIKLLTSDNSKTAKKLLTKIFHIAVKEAYNLVIDTLISDPRVKVHANKNEAIQILCCRNNADHVQKMLANPKVNPAINNNECIRAACGLGKLNVVKVLLADRRVNPGAKKNKALYSAIFDGYHEVVSLLLSHAKVNPTKHNFNFFLRPCGSGHIEVVKILLSDPRFNPNIENNRAIYTAAYNNQTEIMKLLLADSRVDPTMNGTNEAINVAILFTQINAVKLLIPRTDMTTITNPIIRLIAYQMQLTDDPLVKDKLIDFMKMNSIGYSINNDNSFTITNPDGYAFCLKY